MSGKIRAAFAVALAAAGLTGCAGLNGYSVRDEHAAQQDVIGDVVHVGAALCLDDDVDAITGAGDSFSRSLAIPANGDGVCDSRPHQAGFTQGFADNGGVQFFGAFLVPDSAKAPATATATLPSGFDATTVTLTRKPSLDETLQHTRPAPAGQQWVGYISPVVGQAAEPGEDLPELAAGLQRMAESDTPPATDGNGDWSVAADFTPARGDGGLPAPATFAHAVLGGMRMAYPESLYDGVDPNGLDATGSESFGLQLLDSRPVDCQEYRGFPYPQLYGVDLEGLETNDHGLPLVPTTLCGRTSPGGALALKDLRGSGGEASVVAGEKAKVPFTLRYVGDPGPSFALSASTGMPGAAVSPSPAVLTPAAPGFQDATVTVAVPSATAPGAYAVTLTATVGGQVRTAQGTVNVTAPASAKATPDVGQDADADADIAGAGATTTASVRTRMLEFRGFDRSGVGPDGKSINLGDVLCHKAEGSCGWVTVQLTVRWEQLHAGAEAARAAARSRVRMVTIGTASLNVPAQGRRRVTVSLAPGVVKLLNSGLILHAVVAVRPARNRVPMVHRIALRRG
ncbi:hypothetical protein [Baekduia sp.]|jgi:hypothetical protein|uniref:COG1470 family protein n=1 Tax=Baekduia sp. TaxID=2600305 RepID=UPI002E0BDFE9|nr:hypothetical protein [Baekduia sp.]